MKAPLAQAAAEAAFQLAVLLYFPGLRNRTMHLQTRISAWAAPQRTPFPRPKSLGWGNKGDRWGVGWGQII